jgi:hypothetical protein
MDAESLVQVQEIVTSAITTAITGLRHELASDTAGLRQELASTAVGFRQELVSTAASLRQELVTAVTDLRREIADSREETKRHTGVLIEDVYHKLDLVVEGMQFLRQADADIRAEIVHESRETRALLKLSYQQLDQRVTYLEQRLGPAS